MISKEALEKVLEGKPNEVKSKIVLLYNGMAQSAKAYQDDPTATNLRNWRASETELDNFLVQVSPKEPSFPNVLAVVQYLQDQGWKIAQRTGYNHNDQGLLRPRSDGRFYRTDVDAYASSILQRVDGSEPTDSDLERKRKADADTAEIITRIKRIQAEALEGKYIERDAFERALAQRAALFKNDLEALARGKCTDIISKVSGDRDKAPDLIEYLLNEFELCLSRYAANIEFSAPDIGLVISDEEDDA